MEHETSQNLIKVELTVKQLTSILINFDYLNKLAKERGKSQIAVKYSNDIEPFKKALNYTLAEDPRQFSAEEIDPDNNYIKSMAESASLGISTLTLSAKTNQEDSNTAIVYDSASEEIVDSFTMRKEQITQIIDASQTGLNDDINKIIATLKNYLKSHEIKPYE